MKGKVIMVQDSVRHEIVGDQVRTHRELRADDTYLGTRMPTPAMYASPEWAGWVIRHFGLPA
ncbi:hypothetical protein O6Y00_00565 [Sphingomonas faeni]